MRNKEDEMKKMKFQAGLVFALILLFVLSLVIIVLTNSYIGAPN